MIDSTQTLLTVGSYGAEVSLRIAYHKSNTNKVKSGHTGAYSTYTHSTSSNNIPEREVPAGFADEVIYSLFAKQSEDLNLLHEDLEQIDDMDIEEMDINWKIAMIAIRMKKFYKKTGRRVRIDGNKKPVDCPSKGIMMKKRDSFYQDQGAGKKEQNQNCLLTMDDGVVNWGEHTEEEVETNHALMAISSNNELGEKEVKILAYVIAVEIEAQVVTWRIGMKAVKEKEQLQKTVDSWKDSSKNLWKLVDSGMSSTSKVGLGYEIKSNDEVLSYEEEMNHTVFNCTEEDFIDKPLSNVNTGSFNINTVKAKQPINTSNSNSFSPVRPQDSSIKKHGGQRYALTHNLTIHDSLVKQFWQTATASTLADGTLELRATIDTLEYTITEASVRSKLQLADASGISMLPNTEIFEGMGNMGYPADGTFTFWKSHFTPQWRFLVHHILHCMSPKSGGWDQFGSNLATALICLSTGRIYNFSKLIFDGMVANLKSKTKFLMYPRFLQMILEIQTENKHPYLAIVLTKKIFGNMKRGFRGVPRPLLPAMLPVVAVDQSAGQADQAVDQPSPSKPLPSSSHPLYICKPLSLPTLC
ncbi:hypothetical protein Tco_1203515 [Tanacetum coccineum]